MANVTMKSLLEAGVHFGHRTRRWNPKMKPFIFTERNGIHIIDLQQTIVRLEQAYNLVRDTVAEGGTIVFVGTKKQAAENLAAAAESCGMPYVNHRWLGGTLTNWQTIKQRISYLLELEQRRDIGDFDRLPKKEALKLEQLIAKLNRRLGGLKNMTRLPNLIFVVDVRREAITRPNTSSIASKGSWVPGSPCPSTKSWKLPHRMGSNGTGSPSRTKCSQMAASSMECSPRWFSSSAKAASSPSAAEAGASPRARASGHLLPARARLRGGAL